MSIPSRSSIKVVQQFVESGGCLLILARGGIARGVNTLAEQFDFQFDGTTLASPTNVDVRAETTARPLNRMVPFQMVHVGTALTDVGSATVLSRVPADSQAYFDSDSSSNREAAGNPVMAARTAGAGIVAAYGQVYDFQKPLLQVNRRDIVRNILNLFTAHTARSDSTRNQETATPDATT